MVKKTRILKLTLLLISLFTQGGYLVSQNNNALYMAFIQNRPNIWKTELSHMRAKLNTNEAYISYLEYLYGYTGWCIRDNDKKEASACLEELQSILKKELLLPFYENLYTSAAMGYAILLKEGSPLKCGPKAIRSINKALEIDTNSPLALIQKGNVLLQTPGVFGGSAKKALDFFRKAEKMLYERKQTSENWLYVYLLCTMSEVYRSEGEMNQAELYKKQVVKIAPDIFWLKNN